MTKKKTIGAGNEQDETKVSMQRLEQNYEDGTKKKAEVPIFHGGDAESMIKTVREFKEIASDLDFTEPQEKFTNFRKCLRDVARDDWDTAKATFPITEEGFNGTLEAWKQMLLPEDVYENQKNYIETVKKPFNLPVRDFVKRLRQLAAYLPEFPKPQGSTFISDNDMKNIIFRGMPSAWQENFAHANMRITTVTLAQMTDYLASEQVIADTRRENTRGRSPHGGRHNNSGRGFIGGRGRGRHSFSRGGRSNHKRSGTWSARSDSSNAASNDPCRYHGNAHTWKMCYGNPDGPNYRQGFTPRGQNPGGRGRGRFHGGRSNGGGRNDAYQNDAASYNAGYMAATNAASVQTGSPSAASTLTNNGPKPSSWGNSNNHTSSWGRPATNAATDNHWIDSVGAPE